MVRRSLPASLLSRSLSDPLRYTCFGLVAVVSDMTKEYLTNEAQASRKVAKIRTNSRIACNHRVLRYLHDMNWVEKMCVLQSMRGIPWSELCRRAKLSRKSLDRWKTKGRAPKHGPRLDSVLKLAEVLEVTLDELFRDDVSLPEVAEYRVLPRADGIAVAASTVAGVHQQTKRRTRRTVPKAE